MKVFFVNPRLAFGGAIKTAKHAATVRSLGITHVVNLRRSTNEYIGQFPNLWLRFKDDYRPRPAWFYRRALKFFTSVMVRSDTKLFVMCHAGLHRSPSLAYFLLRASGVVSDQAKQMVKTARPRARVVAAYRDSGEQFLQRWAMKGQVTFLPTALTFKSSPPSLPASSRTEQPCLPG